MKMCVLKQTVVGKAEANSMGGDLNQISVVTEHRVNA